MIKMIRIGIWVLILGGSVAERVSALDLQSEEPGFNTRPNLLAGFVQILNQGCKYPTGFPLSSWYC